MLWGMNNGVGPRLSGNDFQRETLKFATSMEDPVRVPSRMRSEKPILLLFCTIAYGCTDLDEFRTGPAEVFQGIVIGSEGDSFIRRSFPAGTQIDMNFDPSLSDSIDPPPGRLTTTTPSVTRVLHSKIRLSCQYLL